MDYVCQTIRGVDVVRLMEREATLHQGVDGFARDLLRLVREHGNSIVMDFGTVHYIDSAMLMTLLGVLRELRSIGRELVLAGVKSDSLQSTLSLSGVLRHVRQYGTIEEAIAGSAMVYRVDDSDLQVHEDRRWRVRPGS
jgi:anti-anti-sigma factor